jgi:hypothetical protein
VAGSSEHGKPSDFLKCGDFISHATISFSRTCSIELAHIQTGDVKKLQNMHLFQDI